MTTAQSKNNRLSFTHQDPAIILPDNLKPGYRATADPWGSDSWYKDRITDRIREYKKMLDDQKWDEAQRFKHIYIDSLERAQEFSRNWRRRDTKKIALTTRDVAAKLIHAINPKTTVRWKTSKETENTYWDEQQKKHVVSLNLAKLHQEHAVGGQKEEPSESMIQATIGQGLHEVAHTLYSPKKIEEFVDTFEQVAVARVFEDIYINGRVLSRLPGAKPYLESSTFWTSPPKETISSINEFIKHNEELPYFEQRLQIHGMTATLAHWASNDAVVNMPTQELADEYNEIEKEAAALFTGEPVEPEDRKKIYQRIADVITRHHPPELCEMPGIESTTNENGGTETALDQMTAAGEKLTDAIGNGEACQEAGTGTSEKNDAEANSLNQMAEASEEANVDGMEGIQIVGGNFNQNYNGYSFRPNVNKKTVEDIRSIFRTRFTERRNYQHGVPEGKLSTRRLHKLLRPTVERNVFKHRPKLDTVNTAILFLVDASGSMSGQPYEVATKSAETVRQAISGNRDYKITIWTYSGSDETVDILPVVVKEDPTETMEWPPLWGGGTPSYTALGRAYQFLHHNYPNANKIILHFTDAAPGGGNADFEWLTRLRKDNSAAYASIAVCDQNYLNNIINTLPLLRCMKDNTGNLVNAVKEFVLNHAG